MFRIASLSLILLLPALGSAQEKFTITVKKRAKGEFVKVTSDEKSVNKITVLDPTGKEVEKKDEESTTVSKYTEEVLEKIPGKPSTKLERNYEQAMFGTEKLPYHGKKVLIEKKAEEYVFTFDGKTFKASEVGPLAKSFGDAKKDTDDSEKLLLPAKPVGVGESWDIDSKTVFKEFGDDLVKSFDLDKAKSTGKLVKAYKKDGKQFGVIEISLFSPMKSLPSSGFPCTEGSSFELKMSMDMCIDGTLETGMMKAEMKMKGSAKVLQDGKDTGAVVKFDVSNSGMESKEPAKK